MRPCLIGLICLLVPQLKATTVQLSSFSTQYAFQGFLGLAYDPGSGEFYTHAGYGDRSAVINVYSDVQSFQNNTPASSVDVGNLSGTYFGASGGFIYGRPDSESSTLAMWTAADGSLLSTNSYPNFDGANGSGTFDWGGYSGMNLFQSQEGFYLFAKSLETANWTISLLDNSLNIQQTFETTLSNAGYAFLLNGFLFVGDGYNDSRISNKVDVSTGAVTPVDFQLSLNGASDYYISSTLYDSTRDRLYISNREDGTIYSVDQVSSNFNQPVLTPEPAAFGLSLSGLGVLYMIHRRRRAVSPIA